MRQVEVSRTLVLDDPRRARRFFEALAVERGWDSEVVRHARVIASIDGHLRRLKKSG